MTFTQETKREMLKGIYDFIANHYWEMSKDQLKTISLEMFWQLEQNKGDYEEATRETIKALEEEDFFEE